MRKLLHLLFLMFFVGVVNAQDLVRGPYQQSSTTNSIKIMWRTSEATIGWVKIGDTPDNLDRVFTESEPKIDHNVQVTGLSAYTKYYYAVGYDDVTLASGLDHFILTNQAYGDTTGFSFWALGDAGKANIPQMMARNAFVEYAKEKPVDFMLMLGDNAYQDGTDEEYQQKVFGREYAYDSILRYLHYYSTPGNHDYNILRAASLLDWLDPTIDKGVYFDIHEVFKNGEGGGLASGTEIYYSFDYGHVHFVCLNSETYGWTAKGPSPMKNWLKKDLEANKLPWTIVFIHQPPYASGSHNSDDFYQVPMTNVRSNILPILEEAGVDLVLTGHSHAYERSYLLKGHYMRSPSFDPAKHVINYTSGNPDLGEGYVKDESNQGTVYSIVGNGGSYTSPDKYPAKINPVFYIRDAGTDVTGSVVVNVKGGTLGVEYINRFGDILDKYSITKDISQKLPTSVKNNYVDLYEMNVFPNPSSEFLSLQFNNPSLSRARIFVTDMSGRQLLVQESNANGIATLQVDGWKQLPTGSYVVSLEIDGKVGSVNVAKVK